MAITTTGLKNEIREIIEDLGERAAAREMGLSVQTISRALAGQSIQAGTIALLEQRIAARKDTTK